MNGNGPSWLKNTLIGGAITVFLAVPTVAYNIIILPMQTSIRDNTNELKDDEKEIQSLRIEVARLRDKVGLMNQDPVTHKKN